MKLLKRIFSLIVIVLLVASGCQGQNAPASPSTATPPADAGPGTSSPTPVSLQGDEKLQITVVTPDLTSTLDPYLMVQQSSEESIAAHLWDTLVWINDDLSLTPRLATAWRLVNDLTWEIKLRQDIVFPNGEAFDAQAVKYSIERTLELGESLETVASDIGLQSVEIIDDYTVQIHTITPAVSAIYELATVEMLPPTYYTQNVPDYLSNNPMGSGPYQVVGWEPGRRIILEANPDYWQGPPTIDTLIFQVEEDAEARINALVDSQADLITDLPPDAATTVDTQHSRLEAIEGTRRLFVGLQVQNDTPIADKQVRQALNYAVDVQALIDTYHAGYGQRYGSWVNPPNANPNTPPWPYDPDRARELLVEAGYPEGFEVTMDTPIGRYYRDQEIAQAIAAQLSEIGVTVQIQPQDWETYVKQHLIPKETAPLFLLGLMSRGNGLQDVQNLSYGFPFNPTLWYNEEFERVFEEAERTFNQSIHINLLYQAQTIAYEEVPWIWLWRPYLLYGVDNNLDWWHPRADGLIYLYTTPALETDN